MKCPKCQSTKLMLVMGADRVRCQGCGSYFDAEEVVSDRDLILKRIAYQIDEADKLIRNDPYRCMIASEYAKGEILGMTSLREFIEASIPAEPTVADRLTERVADLEQTNRVLTDRNSELFNRCVEKQKQIDALQKPAQRVEELEKE